MNSNSLKGPSRSRGGLGLSINIFGSEKVVKYIQFIQKNNSTLYSMPKENVDYSNLFSISDEKF